MSIPIRLCARANDRKFNGKNKLIKNAARIGDSPEKIRRARLQYAPTRKNHIHQLPKEGLVGCGSCVGKNGWSIKMGCCKTNFAAALENEIFMQEGR